MTFLFGINFVTYTTLLISILVSIILSGIILLLSFLLAVQAPDSEKTSAYECGFEPFEDARNRFDVRFYIVAILFLIFDLEVALLLPWGLSLGFTGIIGYTTAVLFLLVLILGFVYEIIKGALDPQ